MQMVCLALAAVAHRGGQQQLTRVVPQVRQMVVLAAMVSTILIGTPLERLITDQAAVVVGRLILLALLPEAEGATVVGQVAAAVVDLEALMAQTQVAAAMAAMVMCGS